MYLFMQQRPKKMLFRYFLLNNVCASSPTGLVLAYALLLGIVFKPKTVRSKLSFMFVVIKPLRVL